MKEYQVVITETLQKTVTIEAESPAAALQMVTDAYFRGEHILDADCFQEVNFQNASMPKRSLDRQISDATDAQRSAGSPVQEKVPEAGR